MESSSLSIIVPIAVGIIIFLFEKATEKKNVSVSSHKAPQQRRPSVAVSHQADEAAHRAEAERHAALARRRAVAATKIKETPNPAHVVQPLSEEGVRVTVDRPSAPAPRMRSAVPPVPGGDLRKAIIWSEILKRKF